MGGESLSIFGPVGREFTEALLGAYPSHSALAQMFQHHLDINLATVATGNLRDVVAGALTWANSQGRLTDLLCAARQGNPDNLRLFQFAARFGPRRQLT